MDHLCPQKILLLCSERNGEPESRLLFLYRLSYFLSAAPSILALATFFFLRACVSSVFKAVRLPHWLNFVSENFAAAPPSRRHLKGGGAHHLVAFARVCSVSCRWHRRDCEVKINNSLALSLQPLRRHRGNKTPANVPA